MGEKPYLFIKIDVKRSCPFQRQSDMQVFLINMDVQSLEKSDLGLNLFFPQIPLETSFLQFHQ